MKRENSFYDGNIEETGAHLIDLRELVTWDPVQEMQEQLNHEIDENLEKDEQLRQLKEDRDKIKKFWQEIMAKNEDEKKSK